MKITYIIDKITNLYTVILLTVIFLFYVIFSENGSLTLEEIKFFITIFSLLAVFSHRYEEDKAHLFCFTFVAFCILLFLAIRFSKYSYYFPQNSVVPDKSWKDSWDTFIIVIVTNAFILFSTLFFIYSYLSMPRNHVNRKYYDSSYEIFKLFNKSINYSLNDNEKIKIKDFCKSEIGKLKSKPIYKYRRYRFLKLFYKNPYNRKQYIMTLKKIKMYSQINEKLYITYNI